MGLGGRFTETHKPFPEVHVYQPFHEEKTGTGNVGEMQYEHQVLFTMLTRKGTKLNCPRRRWCVKSRRRFSILKFPTTLVTGAQATTNFGETVEQMAKRCGHTAVLEHLVQAASDRRFADRDVHDAEINRRML